VAVEAQSSSVSLAGQKLAVANFQAQASGKLQLGIRPEYVSVSSSSRGKNVLGAEIVGVQDQGNTRVVTCRVGDQTLRMKLPREIQVPESGALALHLPVEKSLLYLDGNLVGA